MSYQFLNRCNGYSFEHEVYSSNAQLVFDMMFSSMKDLAKRLLEDSKLDVYFGDRFHDPKSVLRRIQSAAYEEEFLKDAGEWMLDAFRDCAQADHWYTFEKSYE